MLRSFADIHEYPVATATHKAVEVYERLVVRSSYHCGFLSRLLCVMGISSQIQIMHQISSSAVRYSPSSPFLTHIHSSGHGSIHTCTTLHIRHVLLYSSRYGTAAPRKAYLQGRQPPHAARYEWCGVRGRNRGDDWCASLSLLRCVCLLEVIFCHSLSRAHRPRV